jgi:amino acid adenylation domain-containing protein
MVSMLRASTGLPIDHGGPIDRPFQPFSVSELDGSLIDRFETIVRRFPDRLAVQDGRCRLTYAELAALADRIAAAISAAASTRPGPVAILMRSEARFVGAMLGVLAAGRGYVPLDAAQPFTRNQLIATQARAAALISVDQLAHEARALFPSEVPVIDVARLDEFPQAKRSRRPGPDDISYIVYTSGSTGTPKGVYQDHRGHLHDLMQMTDTLHLTPEDRLSLVFPVSAVSACRDIYGAILNGGSVHILPPRDFPIRKLVEQIRESGITILHASPTLFRRLADVIGPGERLDTVRILYLGSDRMHWSDVDKFRRICPPQSFLYVTLASTECMVHTHWFVDGRLQAAGAPFPVGRSAPDWNVTLVDGDGRAVADDQIGELVVTGRYMALGYWNAPDLARQAFAADPADPHSRVFRSGDLCRRRPDGLLEYVGRKDAQIKLHGYRIEPAEIEDAFLCCPEIAEAAVVARHAKDGLPQALVAYVKLGKDVKGLLPRHLAAILQRRLPEHMIPWPIFIVDEFPRLPSLKIDRPKLAQMDVRSEIDGSHRVENPIIDEVAKVFEHVLEVDGATSEDNVSSLGGDSLQAIEIAAQLEARFGITVSAEAMASARTIRDLGLWIANQRQPRER